MSKHKRVISSHVQESKNSKSVVSVWLILKHSKEGQRFYFVFWIDGLEGRGMVSQRIKPQTILTKGHLNQGTGIEGLRRAQKLPADASAGTARAKPDPEDFPRQSVQVPVQTSHRQCLKEGIQR